MKHLVHHGVALAAMFGLAACKSFDSSELKHDFGQTKNPRQTPLDPCTAYDGAADSSGYLKSIFDKITRANPETFQGFYDPSRFCLNLAMVKEINAQAEPKDGTIIMNAGLILAAESDAVVAAVMAHELAHVTMQSGRAPIENRFKDLVKHPEYLELVREENARRLAEVTRADNIGKLASDLSKAKDDFYQSLSSEQRSELDITITQVERIDEDLSRLEKKFSESHASLLLDKSLNDSERQTRGKVLWTEYQRGQSDLQKRLDAARADQEEIARKLAFNNAFGKTWMAIESSYNAALATDRSILLEQTDLGKKMEEVVTSILGAGVLFNWTEQEADEIGLELFVRAGFDADHYADVYDMFMSQMESEETAAACKKFLANFKSGDQPPSRGGGTHPKNCWRSYNISAVELKAHSAEYAEIKKQLEQRGEKPIVNMPQSGLVALQAELRAKLEKAPQQ